MSPLKQHTFNTFILLVFCLVSMAAQAQQITSGVIRDDADGLPLPGATVVVKGTTTGTVTDLDGKFSLSVDGPETILVISMIGFSSQEIAAGEGGNLKIRMRVDAQDLDEFVVTALGISREKKALGYAVADVDMESATQARDANVVNTIQGKVAGVNVTKTTGGPGASSRIVIRGNGSIVNNNQPLVVVDGIPIDNTTVGSGGTWGGFDFGSPISDINPDDIESMTILKGPNAAALYGSRALNGVIVITTKSGQSGKGKLDVSFNTTTSFERAYIVKDFQDEYGAGTNGQLKYNSDGIAFFETDRPTTPTFASSWGPRFDDQRYIDWDGEERTYSAQPNNYRDNFRTGVTLTNSVSVGYGQKKFNARVGYTNLHNTGITPNSSFDRHNVTLNSSVTPTDKFTAAVKVNYARQDAKNRINLSNGDNFARNIIMAPRNISAESLADFESSSGDEKVWYDAWNWIGNPYFQLNRNTNFDHRDRILGNIALTYKLTDWLSITGRTGVDYFEEFRDNRTDYHSFINPRGSWVRQDITFREHNSDLLITANKKVNNNFEVTGNLGGNQMYQKRQFDDLAASEMTEPDLYELDNFNRERIMRNSQFFERRINSVYASGQVAYKSYLFLDVTARNDWSSTLPKANNSYFYPSASLAYAFTDHKTIIDPSILSFGKVRVSVAEVGKDADPYLLELLYDSLATFNGVELYGVHNPFPLVNLKPEKKQSIEAGLDLRFFNDRFSIDFTYYRERTTNQILRSSVSPATGFGSAIVNAGEIRNRGIELLVSATVLQKKSFSWRSIANFTKNDNLVVALNDEVDREVLGSQWRIDVTAAEGLPYGALFGYGIQRDGSGNALLNADGTYVRTDEPIYLGHINPDFQLGLTQELSWKQFTMSFLVDIKSGGKLYSASNMYLHGYSGNVQATVEGRDEWYDSEDARVAAGVGASGYDAEGNYVSNWTATGGYQVDGVYAPGTILNGEDVSGQPAEQYINPQTYWSQHATWTNEIHEPFVYDASYVKLRELLITYRFSEKLANKLKLKGLSFSIVGRNLWLIYSAIPNVDPEAAYNNSNGQGVEWATFPVTRSVGFNLKANF